MDLTLHNAVVRENADEMRMGGMEGMGDKGDERSWCVRFLSNHAGGVLGGICHRTARYSPICS